MTGGGGEARGSGAGFRVAILADVHFHDPEGDFGAGITLGGRRLALRSWADTETGPRAVNESAAILRAALDRIVAEGITQVVLAGDYTDDGQAETTWRLAALLHDYQDRHGLRIHALPGNHDLYASHGKHVTTRLVSAPGKTVLVSSDPAHAGDGIVTPAMRCGGMPEALMPMAGFGYFRQPWHLHWESPFGPGDAIEARMFEARAADGSVAHRLMDASYLVEPEAGLLLLMLDANVFEPRPGRGDPSRKKAFLDPADAGWTAALRVKPHLLPWIGDVTARARAEGKTLVTVSHYPVLDPFQDRAGSAEALFGRTGLVRRTPAPEVGRALARAGLRWHAGGHLHVSAVTRDAGPEGDLLDLALPSLAAFPSGFHVLHARGEAVRAERMSLDDVTLDPDILALYGAEGREGPTLPLGPFLAAQFRARVAKRRLQAEWPEPLLRWTRGKSVQDLVTLLSPPATGAEASWQDYPLTELIVDACILHEAGAEAMRWIAPQRLQFCQTLADRFGDLAADPRMSEAAFFRRFLALLGQSLARAEAAARAIDA